MKQPYQFAFHERVSKTPPYCEIWEIASENKHLSRAQKDKIFQRIGTEPNLKVLGWIFPFQQFLKCFLVKYKHESRTWHEIWAPDKTSIRKNPFTNSQIQEIIEKPKKNVTPRITKHHSRILLQRH